MYFRDNLVLFCVWGIQQQEQQSVFSDQYRLGTWGSALYSAFEGKYGKQFRTDFSERLHNGGMFEFACGFLCEKVLDVTFWDYSALPFSLGRYVNLVFCCFWGLAALCWCRKIYPMIRRILMEKTRKSSRLLTQGFAVFMLLTTLMSGAALLRMSERSQDLPPQNSFEQYLDQHYSDEILQKCFPKMKPADLVVPSDQYLADR